MSKWFLLFTAAVSLAASATPVSLLQETRAIECSFVKAHPSFDRLVIDAKDTKIEAFKAGAKAAEFARTKFLDSAILLEGNGGGALFQILMNGEAQFTEGRMITFLEKDCDDTGASKTCTSAEFKKLFWSPERLELQLDKKTGGAIRQYGFFANHATYFLSEGLSLLDYGRELNLLVGQARPLKCKYLN